MSLFSIPGVVGNRFELTIEPPASTVDPAGTISQPFFTPKGQLVAVNGQQVQVFEFASAAKADAAAETVSADGGSVGTTMMTWAATPHFYQASQVIALYVGDDSEVVSFLEEAMGPQFAGR